MLMEGKGEGRGLIGNLLHYTLCVLQRTMCSFTFVKGDCMKERGGWSIRENFGGHGNLTD